MGFIIPCKCGFVGPPKLNHVKRPFSIWPWWRNLKDQRPQNQGPYSAWDPYLVAPTLLQRIYKEPMHTTRADFHLTSLEICALQQVSCSNTSVRWVFDWPLGISPYYTEYICIWPLGVFFFKTRAYLIIRTFINSNTWNHTQPKGKKMERVSIKNLDSYPFNTLH